MGHFENVIKEAFGYLEEGKIALFITTLIDSADYGVRYQWQKNKFDTFLRARLEKYGLQGDKAIPKIGDIIKQRRVEEEI